MLKRIFTSNTRIKLLTVFLSNPDEEYFIRELTRKLDEQINSIRRELDNLKKTGLLRSRLKNRKKYYYINKNFLFLEELQSMFKKALSSNQNVAKEIGKMGKVKLLALSGLFIEKATNTVDMLIVGDIDKEKFAKYLNTDLRTQRPVKFTIMSEDDYKYRLDLKDKFITDTINDPQTEILIKNI